MKSKILLSLLVCFLIGVLFGARLWLPLLLVAATPGAWFGWKYYQREKTPRLPGTPEA